MKRSTRKTWVWCLVLLLGLILVAAINGELRYRTLLQWENDHEGADAPVVSSGFQGSAWQMGDRKLCQGKLSFVLCNLPEEEGAVQRVTLRKYRDGEEASSRVIDRPWYNIVYTLRNQTGGTTCEPRVFSAVRQGSQVEYWIEAVTADGTMYRTLAFRLDTETEDLAANSNIRTEVYTAQGELRGTLPGR